MARVGYVYGRKLAEARDLRSMTQRELGDAIGGVSDETISRVERHEVAGILAKRLPKLAAALGMTLEQFKADLCPPEPIRASLPIPGRKGGNLGRTGGLGLPEGVNMRRSHPARALAEYTIGVAADQRVHKVSDKPDSLRMVATQDRRAFTAPVDGDCQLPKWKHGETVIFSFEAVDREGILPGKSYYFAFADGTTTFKRVFLDENDPDVYILRCWNRKKYPADKRVTANEVVRIARAMSKQVVVEENEDE